MIDVVVSMKRLGMCAGSHGECDRCTGLGFGYGTSWFVTMLHFVSKRFHLPKQSVQGRTQYSRRVLVRKCALTWCQMWLPAILSA